MMDLLLGLIIMVKRMQVLSLRFEDFLKILGTLTVIEGQEAVSGVKFCNGKYCRV